MLNKKELRKWGYRADIPTAAPYPDSHMYFGSEEKNGILVLNAYHANGRSLQCVYRLFFTKEAYITWDVLHKKWLQGTVTAGKFMKRENGTSYEKIFLTVQDHDTFYNFLKRIIPEAFTEDSSVWNVCKIFQDSILSRKLDIRLQEERDKIDKELSFIEEIPSDFYKWIDKEVMTWSHFLVYQAHKNSRQKVSCYCTACKQEGVYDRRTIGNLKHNNVGKCPSCGNPVTFKANGRISMDNIFKATAYAEYINPKKDGFCERFFYITRTYCKTADMRLTYKDDAKETIRSVYTHTDGKTVYKEYQFDYFHKKYELRWGYGYSNTGLFYRKQYDVYNSCLYYKNLPKAFGDSLLHRFELEKVSQSYPGEHLMFHSLITAVEQNNPKYNGIEQLMKCGFIRLTADILNVDAPTNNEYGYIYGANGYIRRATASASGVDLTKTSLKDILGLNQPYHPNGLHIQRLRALNATYDQLIVIQLFDTYNINYTKQDVIEYADVFERDATPLYPEYRMASIHKICRYIKETAKKENSNCRTTRRNWYDFLKWCHALRKNMHDEYYFMPPNFTKAHDAMQKEYLPLVNAINAKDKALRDKMFAENMQRQKNYIAERFPQTKDGGFLINGKKLLLVIPEKAEELVEEGDFQHHCVGTYIPEVALGNTVVFFIRKADDINTPFYTIEFKYYSVNMCTGYRNKKMTPDVEAFAKAFELKMRQTNKLIS